MKDSAKPSIYLLIGDDQHAKQVEVKKFIALMGADPGMADLNTTRLDGGKASDTELAEAVNALPFLTERRLVILDNPISGNKGETWRERFLALLDTVPPSTALVILLDDEFNYRGNALKFDDKHWLMRWTAGKTAQNRVFIKFFPLPTAADMPEWVMKEAQKQGGAFSRQAAEALAAETGSNTEQALREIEKLLTYVNFQRPVELEDIQELVIPGGAGTIFDMVKAIGLGDKRRALNLLHHLLDEQDAARLFPMIVRQFRLLLLARELLDENRLNAETANKVGIKSARQLEEFSTQARRFEITGLEAIYHRLLEMDEQFKTSQVDLSVALDTFIAEL